METGAFHVWSHRGSAPRDQACRRCGQSKPDNQPETSGVQLLFNRGLG